MIRAFLLNLIGGHFEVRLINLKSGKDIPGTRLYKGGYFKCRRIFRDKHLKYGQLVRLQAVSVLDYRINETPEMIIVDEAAEVSPEAWDVDASNARQSEFMHEHQDEPNVYNGEDEGDHECDSDGPMDWDVDTDGYRSTCSFCGAFRG